MLHSRKYYIIGGVIALIIVLSFLALYWVRDDTINTSKYVTELKVEDTETSSVYELKIGKDDGYRYYFENGKKVKKVSSIKRTTDLSIFELPVVSEEYDVVTKEQPISELTWKSSLDTSAKYIKYLELSGYTATRTVYTPSYIELFMKKGSIVKRLVVLKESIMVGDLVDNVKLPSIENLFKNKI